MRKRYIFVVILNLFLIQLYSQQVGFSKEALLDVLITLEGEEVTFESIIEKNKGNAVFIDIWASWCKDCIVGMPKLKKIMENYPAMKFVYLSVDKTDKSWKKGIKKYKLSKGQHYFAANGWKSDVFSSIDLDWIPRYMLLDKEGKITLFKAITLEGIEMKM